MTVFLVGTIVLPTFAQPNQAMQAFDRRVVQRIDIDNIWGHLEVLTEDIGVRATGTSEEIVAAHYLAGVFESYGYDVVLQEYDLPDFVIVPEVNVVAPFEYKLYPAPATRSGLTTGDGLTAQLMDWGDSLTPPDGWESGMIAMMNQIGTSTNYTTQRDAALGADASAVVIVFRSKEIQLRGGFVDAPTSIPVIAVHPGQAEDIRYLLEEDEVILNIQLEIDKPSYNVVATRESNNKNKPNDEVLIIGGHYDSVYGSPGANDNAASPCTMLEIARVLANYPLDMDLVFVAFGGEERGFLGARAYVDSLSEEQKASVAGMINLEMLGSAYEPVEYLYVATGLAGAPTSFLTDSMIASGARIGKEVQWGGRVMGSDHMPFHWAGITACVVARAYPGPIPWDPLGRFGLEPQYHAPTDTMEYMCKDRLEESARIIAVAVHDISRKQVPSLTRSAIRRDLPEVSFPD